MSESHIPPPPPEAEAAAAALAPSSFFDPSSQSLLRDYRKGNWTVQETLTLITAKRLDDERRSSSSAVKPASSPTAAAAGPATPRSAEQRWKWVENYCWRHGCLRSQNQCNDKWDNLLRDYKKVRDYETKLLTQQLEEEAQPIGPNTRPSNSSYWALERHQRKDRNLPTNLSPEVFEALTDVLSRRNSRRSSASSATPISSLPPPPPPPPLPPPPPPPPPPQPQPSVSVDVSDSEDSETEEPDMKRRKVRGLGSGVVRGASVLARTLMACEEKREQRHRELLELEARRLKLEEERTEMNRQAVSGLISAVSGLSNAINALVSGHHNGSSGGGGIIDNRSQI